MIAFATPDGLRLAAAWAIGLVAVVLVSGFALWVRSTAGDALDRRRAEDAIERARERAERYERRQRRRAARSLIPR